MPRWIPQAHAYINPVQDIEAQMAEVRGGFSSRKQKISERGYDIEEVDAEIAADNERTYNLGIILDSNPQYVSRAGVTQARPGGTGFADADTEPEIPDYSPSPEAIAAAKERELRAEADLERARAETARAFDLYLEATKAMAEANKGSGDKSPVNINLAADLKEAIAAIQTPVINVTAPEQPAPIINYIPPAPEKPKRRKTKTVVDAHDERGRIKSFTQEEID
jgi:hypothetical protein